MLNSVFSFCEEDYIVSFYLAEFINSLTNVAYSTLSVKSLPCKLEDNMQGTRLIRIRPHAVYFAFCAMSPSGPSIRLSHPKVDFMSLSLLVLGIGSFLFHATLRQTLEFVDEFSMLGLTWSMLQAGLTTRQPPARARLITATLAVAYISFSAFYLWSAKIIYQVFAFTGALLGVLFRSQYVFHFARPSLPEAKRRDWNRRTWKALGVCVFGYLLWTIDLEYCAELRAVRARVGLPWAWLFEFHGWWHILTAVGASQAMEVAREVRREVEKEERGVDKSK